MIWLDLLQDIVLTIIFVVVAGRLFKLYLRPGLQDALKSEKLEEQEQAKVYQNLLAHKKLEENKVIALHDDLVSLQQRVQLWRRKVEDDAQDLLQQKQERFVAYQAKLQKQQENYAKKQALNKELSKVVCQLRIQLAEQIKAEDGKILFDQFMSKSYVSK